MKIKYIYIVITSLMFFAACDTNSDVELTTDTVIVDGYLFASQGVDSLRITKSNSYSSTDTTLVTFDNLEISISDGTETFLLSSIGDGYYQNLDEIIEYEKTYELSFEYNGKTVYSSTYIPAQRAATISADIISLEKIEIGERPTFTQSDPIELNWNNDEGDYYYVYIKNIEDNPEYINEMLATGGFARPFTFVTEPSIMDTYNIDTRRDLTQFGTHEIVIFRVNPEYAAMYATADATSTSIVEPPTNIENGLGIFTGVSSDTLYLEVGQL